MLQKKKVKLLAVTIDCFGETYCKNNEGAKNAAKILSLAGKPNVSIYTGKPPSINHWPSFPTMIRAQATAMNITGFKLIPYNKKSIKLEPAAKTIVQIIEREGKKNNPVTFISIGSAANINDAIQYVRRQSNSKRMLFKRGISMIIKGGGAFGKPVSDNKKGETISNQKIQGNLNIPGIYTTKNKKSEWNIYVAVRKIEGLLRSKIPITFIPINLTNQLFITKKSLTLLKHNIRNKIIKKFVTNIIQDTVKRQGGWNAGLSFWDLAVVAVALNPSMITKEYDEVEVCVNTHKNFAFYEKKVLRRSYFIKDDNNYATMFINKPQRVLLENRIQKMTTCSILHEPIKKVKIIASINTKRFYQDILKVYR